MKRAQLITIAIFTVLFCVLYFGFRTKSSEHSDLEKSRLVNFEETDIRTLIKEAKAELSESDNPQLESLETALYHLSDDSSKTEILMELSGFWYRMERPDISGHYATEVAEMENSEDAWSIAGTTFAAGITGFGDGKEREFCIVKAISSFEKAISINPDNSVHRLNLALCYTKAPPSDNPMKGILMLREMNEKEPDNVHVLVALGKLAIQTGQYSKAIERLTAAFELENENRSVACLLSVAYEGIGNGEAAKDYYILCESEVQE